MLSRRRVRRLRTETIRNTRSNALLYAAANGDVETVKRLLSKAEVNAENKRSGTLLHVAAERGHLKVVEVLLNSRANFNKASKFFNNSTPVHLAAEGGHADILSVLLSHGAVVDAKNKIGRTPLHLTASRKCAKLLLDFKAKVNVKDMYDFSPLHLAARKGCVEIVRMLLIMGANVKAVSKYTRATPLHLAAANGHVKVVKLLLNQKACSDVKDIRCNTPLYYAISNDKVETAELLFNHQNMGINDLLNQRFEFNLLHSKSLHGHVKTIQFLLSKGANVHAANIHNDTPLHLAATEGHSRAVKVLLSAGASPNVADKWADTPLHLAAEYGSTAIVKLLLNAGASVDVLDELAETPLHIAAADGTTAMVELLLSAGASVNCADEFDETPLHLAVRCRSVAVVKLLLRAGAAVNAEDESANTPLHLAAWYGCAVVLNLLLGAGADVNAAGISANTPLHLAAWNGRKMAVKLLLNAGADVNATNANHQTPLHAVDRRCRDVLQQHVAKMMALNLLVSESNRLQVCSDDGMISFRLNCGNEIELMKSQKIANGVSFFDVLTQNARQLIMYARNQDIVQRFKSNVYLSMFPIYASDIKKRFVPAIKRAKLLESGHQFLDISLTGLPRLEFFFADGILMYLSNSDLQLLRDLV